MRPHLLLAALGALGAGLCPAPGRAAPESLEQLEPGGGEFQAEYSALFGQGGESEQSLEAAFGIGGRLVVGIEIEAERAGGRLSLETVGAKALYRFTPEDSKFGVGVQVQLDFDGDATPAEAEVRLIAETKGQRWWGQANLMARRARVEGGFVETAGAYAWSAQRSAAGFAWLGIEGSGHKASACRSPLCGDSGHYLGPSATMEFEIGGAGEVEIGMAVLRRFRGSGPDLSPKLFVQMSF